jgi:putative ABC transport system permease protein
MNEMDIQVTSYSSGAIPLDSVDLTVAALLVLFAGLLSAFFRLGLERKLAVAALRTVLQLLLIGYILRWVFAVQSLAVIVLIIGVMGLIAGRSALDRSSWVYKGAYWDAFLTLIFTGLITTLVVTKTVIGVTPWYDPQYIIPLLGMVLGNGLTGISLALDEVLNRLYNEREKIEMELAHGASKWEASITHLRDAVKRGMIPIINSMMVVGIVSLPGMMTGQILAGADPLDAVKYQVVVMFMLASGTALGTMALVLLTYRRLFNERHQLLWSAIQAKMD